VTDDMFFIPIIAEALKTKNRRAALEAAIERIQEQGKQPRYRKGLAQFERFMLEVREHGRITLKVERNGRQVGTIHMDSHGETVRLGGIEPGRYAIYLSTGRLLWEADIGETDILWSKAFPGRALELAADTPGTQRPPSRREPLSGGLTLLVFPGVETGEIGIEPYDNGSLSDG